MTGLNLVGKIKQNDGVESGG